MGDQGENDQSDRFVCVALFLVAFFFHSGDIKFLSIAFRRVWTGEEDEAIRQLVEKYGTKTWSVIAEQIVKEFGIDGRTGKQCRERWHNHLGELKKQII